MLPWLLGGIGCGDAPDTWKAVYDGDADADADADADTDADADADTTPRDSAGSTTGSTGGTGTTPAECAFPQGVPDEGFVASAASFEDTDPVVDDAVNAAMSAMTGCGVATTCDLTGYGAAPTTDEACQAWFAAVTAELRAEGYCAGQHAVGSTDEIAVSNTGCAGLWYGYHVCNYGGPTVVWNPGARRGWWQIDPAYCAP